MRRYCHNLEMKTTTAETKKQSTTSSLNITYKKNTVELHARDRKHEGELEATRTKTTGATAHMKRPRRLPICALPHHPPPILRSSFVFHGRQKTSRQPRTWASFATSSALQRKSCGNFPDIAGSAMSDALIPSRFCYFKH